MQYNAKQYNTRLNNSPPFIPPTGRYPSSTYPCPNPTHNCSPNSPHHPGLSRLCSLPSTIDCMIRGNNTVQLRTPFETSGALISNLQSTKGRELWLLSHVCRSVTSPLLVCFFFYFSQSSFLVLSSVSFGRHLWIFLLSPDSNVSELLPLVSSRVFSFCSPTSGN